MRGDPMDLPKVKQIKQSRPTPHSSVCFICQRWLNHDWFHYKIAHGDFIPILAVVDVLFSDRGGHSLASITWAAVVLCVPVNDKAILRSGHTI